jgi:hypothetical protein
MNFIEIGSNDYDTLLSSKYFSKTSWGIIVEPVKKYFDNLPIIENVQYLNYAITANKDGIQKFYEPIDHPNPEWVKSIGSLKCDHPTLKELNISKQTVETTVNAMSLQNFYNFIPEDNIHFLKIDAEGTDFELLENWDFIKFKPMHIQFESKLMSTEELNIIIEKLKKENYIVTKAIKKDYAGRAYNHIAQLEF